MKDQKKSGILLSYSNTALSMVINIFLTPLLITCLSDETYRIYKVMQSLAGPLVIFNLGLATITVRCVAKYKATDEDSLRERENSLRMHYARVLPGYKASIQDSVQVILGREQ